MLVRLNHGSRKGEDVDFLPREAHAMLADGRALPVSDAGGASAPVPGPGVIRHADPAPQHRDPVPAGRGTRRGGRR